MRHAKAAAGEWIWREGGGEIPLRGRLFAGRYLGHLCRRRWSRPGVRLSPRGTEETQRRHCTLDRLQKGRTAALLIGSSEQGGRRAGAHFLFECGGQGNGIGKLDQRAMNIG